MKFLLLLFASLLIVVLVLVASHRSKSTAIPAAQEAMKAAMNKKIKGRVPTDSDVADFLAPYLAQIEASKKATVNIALEDMKNDDVFASKVGGIAYWPEAEEYPKAANGEPLFLLAQIRFDEMPPMAGYPDKGMLQFFIADTDYYGANFDGDFSLSQLQVQKDFRVKYWPELREKIVKVAPGDSEMLPHDPKKPRRMKFSAQQELISDSDFRFDRIFGGEAYSVIEQYAAKHGISSDGLADAVFERFNRSGHKIGGYPYFTQTDPRSEPGMELLFQLDSDDDMMWGDVGVGNFFISPEDLQRRDFTRVAYNWDCH